METPTPDRVEVGTSVRAPSHSGGEVRLRRALRAPRAAGSGLREMFHYWRAERSTLRQGMVSLSISALGNIPTGVALGSMQGRLEALPGLFILIPAAVGMRGSIFGALGSRLGTSMHAGLFDLRARRRSALAQNVWASTLLTFTTSLFLAAAARAMAAATGLPTISIWDYMVISVLGGVASSAFVLVFTVGVARQASRRGWDMDSVAAPLITFVGDLITMPSLWAASLLAARDGVTLTVGIASAALCAAAVVGAILTKATIARRIIGESVLTLALAGSVDIVAGAVVEHRAAGIFRPLPALLVMLPAFLENAGALGGIVSSRLASKLHLGAISPRAWPERLAALDISLAAPWSLLNFGATGLTAHFVTVALGEHSPGAWQMVSIALVAGLMATAGAAVVAYAAAIATYRFDLDPDNHGIAAVTSSMDLIGALCLIGAVSILGVNLT